MPKKLYSSSIWLFTNLSTPWIMRRLQEGTGYNMVRLSNLLSRFLLSFITFVSNIQLLCNHLETLLICRTHVCTKKNEKKIPSNQWWRAKMATKYGLKAGFDPFWSVCQYVNHGQQEILVYANRNFGPNNHIRYDNWSEKGNDSCQMIWKMQWQLPRF